MIEDERTQVGEHVKAIFWFLSSIFILYRKLIEELSDQSDLSDDDDSAPANLVTGVSVEADVSAEPFQS